MTEAHSIRFEPARCTACLACLRACPTQAVRVRGGQARMLADRCIDCGECLKVCAEGAVQVLTASLTDLTRFDYTVAVPSPALYTQFEAEVSPGVIHEALRRCGFDGVASLSRACADITAAVELFLADSPEARPLISAFCPTVVRLVQVRYPGLLDRLLRILPPREVAAREAKARIAAETGLPPDRIGTVYLTPCPAKMVSVVDHPGLERSYIDAVLPIRDLFHLLTSAIREVQREGVVRREPETAAAMSWAFSIGRPSSLPAENTLVVAGLPNVVRLLDDIEMGRLGRYALVECHACYEGCVSGPLTVENPYVARARAIRLQQTLGADAPLDRGDLARRYREGEWSLARPIAPWPGVAAVGDLADAVARLKQRDRIRTYLPGIDCGACGSPTCEAFAEDVAAGEADECLCIFVRQRHAEALLKQLRRLVGWPVTPAAAGEGEA